MHPNDCPIFTGISLRRLVLCQCFLRSHSPLNTFFVSCSVQLYSNLISCATLLAARSIMTSTPVRDLRPALTFLQVMLVCHDRHKQFYFIVSLLICFLLLRLCRRLLLAKQPLHLMPSDSDTCGHI